MRKLFLIVCTIFLVVYSNQRIGYIYTNLEIEHSNNLNETENLNTANLNLIKVTTDEVFNDNLNKFIYFGRDTCPVCQIYKPNLISVLQEKNMKIYYFDTDYWREKKEFNEILKRYEINEIPSLIYLNKDGTFKKQNLDKTSKDFEDEKILKKEIIEFIEKYKEV